MTDAFGPTRILHDTCSHVIQDLCMQTDRYTDGQTDRRQAGRQTRMTNRKVLQFKANVPIDYQKLTKTCTSVRVLWCISI